jgi:hypothetical protein
MLTANFREFENQASPIHFYVGSKHQPAEISCPFGKSPSSSLILCSDASEYSDTRSHQSLLDSSEELQLQSCRTVVERVTEG